MKDIIEITALRKRLLSNGFTPLPNLSKICLKRRWPKIKVTDDEIDLWSRIHPDFRATGVRLERGLACIDIDVAHPVIEDILDALEAAYPTLLQAPMRYGSSYKRALFVRSETMFNHLRGRVWTPPGPDENATGHTLEIFAGGASRQFGIYGPHSEGIEYSWDGIGLADVTLDDLPIFTKSEFSEMIDISDGVLDDAGWLRVRSSVAGEDVGKVIYSLNSKMTFDLLDGTSCDLSDLDMYVGFRCSASFLEGDIAKNRTRCLIGRSGGGRGVVTVWDSKSGNTYLPETASREYKEIKRSGSIARMQAWIKKQERKK